MSPSVLQTSVSTPPDLDQRFVEVKQRLIKPENVKLVTESWKRLLVAIEKEFTDIEKTGPSYIPKCDFNSIKDQNSQLMWPIYLDNVDV